MASQSRREEDGKLVAGNVEVDENAEVDGNATMSQQQFDLKIVLAASLVVVLWFTGCGLYYSYGTGWSGIDSLYFLVVTLTTVGYGDLLPNTDNEKFVTCFVIFTGMAMAAQAMGILLVQFSHKMRARSDKYVICLSVLVIFFLAGLGTIAFKSMEDLSWTDSFYLTVVTCTSVGYGDISPKTLWGRVFSIFFIFFGTLATAQALSAVASIPMKYHRRHLEATVIGQYGNQLTRAELEDLVKDPVIQQLHVANASKQQQNQTSMAAANSCSVEEFVLKILIKLDRVTSSEIQDIAAQFHKLDKNGTGRLDIGDTNS